MKASTLALSTLMLMVLVLSFQPYQAADAQTDIPLESKALAYVTNVLPFNMNHYTSKITSSYSLPSGLNDSTQWQTIDIDLISNDSTIHTVCLYVNGVLLQCGVTVTSGTPVSDRSYKNLKEEAARILQKHQEQTGLDSTDLIYVLSLVDEAKTMSVTYGNVTLYVSSTFFEWNYVLNNISYNYVTLTFNNGTFHDLQDDRAEHPIGSTEVRVAKDQAVNNAIQYISNFTNKFNLGISNTTAQLISYPNNYGALYPCWQVYVDFNRTDVMEVDGKVWADSGEVFDCYQGGCPLKMDTLIYNPWLSPTKTPTPTTQPSTTTPQPMATDRPSNNTANSQLSSSNSLAWHQPSASPSDVEKHIQTDGKLQLPSPLVIATLVSCLIASVAVAIYRFKKQTPKRNTEGKNY